MVPGSTHSTKRARLLNLSAEMKQTGFDQNTIKSQVRVDNATYDIPVVNFAYPLFTNNALRPRRGSHTHPLTGPSSSPMPWRSAN